MLQCHICGPIYLQRIGIRGRLQERMSHVVVVQLSPRPRVPEVEARVGSSGELDVGLETRFEISDLQKSVINSIFR